MYAVATMEVAHAAGLGVPGSFAAGLVGVARAAWACVAAGLVGRLATRYRAHPGRRAD